MLSNPIFSGGPSISHTEIEYATSAAAVGWNLNSASYISALEQKMCTFAKQRYALALSSGSSALHLACLALGIGPGDEVLIPEIAHVSVAASVAHTGAKPVFCDVDPRTLCLSIPDASTKITDNTKGIIAVHMHGHPCDMVGVMKLAIPHGLFVLEDASLAFGARFKGNPAGSFGNFAVFSFSQDSALTSGEGGVLLTSDQRLYQQALKLTRNGAVNENPFISECLGYNYTMSNLQASVAVAQLERQKELLDKKKEIFQWYQECFDGQEGLRLNCELDPAQNSYTSTMLFLEKTPVPRMVFLQQLARLGIYCNPVFYPLSSMPMFTRCDNPVAYTVGAKTILLPSGHNRTKEEILYISDVIKALAAGEEEKAREVKPTGWLRYRDESFQILGAAKSEGLIIPFEHNGMQYSLRAMTEEDVKDKEIIRLLTRWRQENSEIFLTRQPVTEQIVAELLQGYGRNHREYILFFVVDAAENEIIGHIGLDNFSFQRNECMVESLIMQPPVPKGLAAKSAEVLYGWAKETLKIKRIYNNVVGSNTKIRLLASAQGFKEIYRLPLYKKETEQGVVFRPMYMPGHETPDEYFVVTARDL